jgi:hypothetical protein
MQLEEAFQMLYRGQSNVAHVSAEVQLPLEKMKVLFREYVARNPLDEQAWRSDVDLTWPYA